MIVLFRVWILLLLMYSPSVWAGDSDTLTPEDCLDKQLHGIKWLGQLKIVWRRMRGIVKLYESVIEQTEDPKLKLAAERGLDQVVFRIDNAHDIYRTLFDPAWWMTGEDNTIEWYDDVYMRAIGNAWGAVDAHLAREIEPANHVGVVVCYSQPQFAKNLYLMKEPIILRRTVTID